MRRLLAVLALVLLAGSAGRAHAQDPGIARALDAERRGNLDVAVQAYREILARRPADAAALLGIERSLAASNRSAELVPLLAPALAAAPTSSAVLSVALRAWVAVDRPDSAEAIVRRWAAVDSTSETPYREWGQAWLDRRDRAKARAAFEAGRARLGQPEVLAAELADVATGEGRYGDALVEWVSAVRTIPSYRTIAVDQLERAPERERAGLLLVLSKATDREAARVHAELLARWGQPVLGFRRLSETLTGDRGDAMEALRGFVDRLRGETGKEGRTARGLALEALANRGAPDGTRLRLEAAQAFSDAGDGEAARRVLAALDRPGQGERADPRAAVVMLDLLVREGKLDEAEQRLEAMSATLPTDERLSLRRRLIAAWMRAGQLGRADSTLARDSSVEGLALAGRVALLRGRLTEAVKRFSAAGPYAGERGDATERTQLLALLQPFEQDTLPALGAAFLTLERGDSAQAVQAFTALAGTLAPDKGGMHLTLLAGQLQARLGRRTEAEALLRKAAEASTPTTAPPAMLELAALLLATERPAEAVKLLEQLIVTYPDSALLPQARRLLDEARGAVPRT